MDSVGLELGQAPPPLGQTLCLSKSQLSPGLSRGYLPLRHFWASVVFGELSGGIEVSQMVMSTQKGFL